MRLVQLGSEPADACASWQAHDDATARMLARFRGLYRMREFDYLQPARLQPGVARRLRRPYVVRVSYADWGQPDAPLVLCTGGVANCAMRFSFLAAELSHHFRVVCMDWLGRGRSGWLADDSEYAMPTYVEQVRQMLDHLAGHALDGGDRQLTRAARPILLGSSLGGSVAIEFAARHPQRVARLVLNDVGPSIPAARRRRRAQALARFYLFRTPDELLRRVGAAQKHDGPVDADIRRFIAHHQTRWSVEHGGRIYRHDPRALTAYRKEAQNSVDQWASWSQVQCPVLLMHGMESDALSRQTIARMRRAHPVLVAHIPGTGHTPVLSDRHQTGVIAQWLRDDLPTMANADFSVPHAAPRETWQWPATLAGGMP